MLQVILPIFGLVVLLGHFFYNAFRRDLSWVPGPFLSRFSNLYRATLSFKGSWIDANVAAHKKYGRLVRWGPNMVTVSDPQMVDHIFGHRTDFEKSDMVVPWQKRIKGKPFTGIVDTKDRRRHAEMKRPIAGVYAMANINANEVFIDDTIAYFVKRLDEVFVRNGGACNIDEWLQWFAYDLIGEITISRKFGLLEAGADTDGALVDIANELKYRSWTGQMPWTHFLFKGNPLYQTLFKPTNEFILQAVKLIQDRKSSGSAHPDRKDMMHKFLEAQKQHPGIVSEPVLNTYITTNLLAGSDTTACVMRAAIYYGIKHPDTWTKIQQELDDNNVTYPITFKKSSALPYLNAFITEVLRYHPIAGFGLERVVPSGGLETPDGHTIPAGTVVGVNAWVTHFDKDVFGEDADEFKPERWLMNEKESEEAYRARISKMRYSDFAFSKGPRRCLGIHIAQQELWKVIPTLVGLFNVSRNQPHWVRGYANMKQMRLAKGPAHEWKLESMFIVKQYDMDVIIEWREGKSVADLKDIDTGEFD